MTTLQRYIRKLGGLAATHELRGLGIGREALRLATHNGEIRRIRKGWYILPDLPAALADCVRVGGRATCMTAVEQAGLWLRDRPTEVHVAVRPNACQLRNPRDYRLREPQTGAVVHWSDTNSHGARLVVPLADAIGQMATCCGIEAAFVATESALVARRLTGADMAMMQRRAPMALSLALARANGLSGSITEAVFLFRILRFGVRVRQQVQIGHDRVDFLLGDRLVIELDSKEFHDKHRDYERDVRLLARGYRVIRFNFRQVMFDWAVVEAALHASIHRGDAV